MNFEEILSLDLPTYLLLRRDAFINKMNETESGREYLANAYRLTQTKQDKQKLRKHFGKESNNGR